MVTGWMQGMRWEGGLSAEESFNKQRRAPACRRLSDLALNSGRRWQEDAIAQAGWNLDGVIPDF